MIHAMQSVGPELVIRAATHPAQGWELAEETMPESDYHDEALTLLQALLSHWAVSSGAKIARNLALRWVEENARIGLDPDMAIYIPAPPKPQKGWFGSIKTWLPGHAPPIVAVEIVSNAYPRKDYETVPLKYAASGTKELWVFDPLSAGPKKDGGPFLLQLWTRDDDGAFRRTHAGKGPAYSKALGAWFGATDGWKLRIAEDAAMTKLWPTEAEATKASANARIAELEAEIARRGG
jgi:Uma2 family endonuclease